MTTPRRSRRPPIAVDDDALRPAVRASSTRVRGRSPVDAPSARSPRESLRASRRARGTLEDDDAATADTSVSEPARRRAAAPPAEAVVPGEDVAPASPEAPAAAESADGDQPVKVAKTPLYPRLLRLQHIHPNAWQRAALGEGAVGVGVLLSMADLATAWSIVALPVAVAGIVKAHDALQGMLDRAAPPPPPA